MSPGLNDLRIAAELARRQRDGISMFRALGPDLDARFPDQAGLFSSQASELLIRGGNRSSKSMCAAALFASIARDKPICTWDGRMIETRRPWQKGRPLVMWIIGLQLNHIGQTIYRLLFKAGAYKIIRDLNTGEFRAYRPWDKSDVARYNETKPSFPLIPPSEIEQKGWSWHQKASRQFEVCKLKNGTEIWTFASTADVKQGDPVDVIWIDEAISNPDHYEEWQMRLPDVKGRIFWSSWPRKGNPALVRLTERAAEQREEYEKGLRTKINVEEFLFTFSGNPFIDEEEKQKVREGLSEEQLRARDLGEYDLDNMKIYPWFDASIHRAIGRIPAEDDTIGRILRDNNGVPPTDWTHELTLDPGTAKPAILLCAIPPQELWEEGEPWFVPYKEFYKARQTASDLAKEIKQYTQGKGITFQRFIIDGQAARITPMGFAGTIGDHYSKAFEKEGLYCDMTGQYFTPGSPDFSQRVMVVENWLRMRRTRPQLRIVVENCKQLVWQMSHNQKHVAENKVEEKEAKNQFNDVRVCFDPKTEVLTADGWKAWPEVSDNDSFATVHMQTGELEYQLPSALVCKEHSGEMIEFNGHKLRGMVTPDHRMVSYPLGCHDIPEFRQACDLRTQDRLRIKPDLWRGQEYESVLVDRVYEGRDQQKEVDPGDMAEFLGWYAAEGCKSLPRCPGHGWRVHLSQIKPHGKELLWSLLCQLPWKFRPDGDGYSCSSKQLWCYLERIGVGGDCYSKEVPGWIKWSSSSIIRRYVTGFVLGDGWQDKGRERCVSASKKLADGIQELYFKLGTASSVKTRPATTATIRGKTYNCREQHVVSEWTSEKAGLYSHDSKRNWSYVPYEGMVYCATVPNGTLVVRREGAPLVAGNCLEYWASRNPQYVLRKQVERRIVTPYDRYCKWKGERFSSRGPATGVTFGGGLR